jgi:hypothetical protein
MIEGDWYRESEEHNTIFYTLRHPFYQGYTTVWLDPRPVYCDRGHWVAGLDGFPLGLDNADSFPRYFMDLERAKLEMSDWLKWRIVRYTMTAGTRTPDTGHQPREEENG